MQFSHNYKHKTVSAQNVQIAKCPICKISGLQKVGFAFFFSQNVQLAKYPVIKMSNTHHNNPTHTTRY